MRTAFVIFALTVPVIALALPDDATLSRLLVGTWHGHRHDTQYRADGTWIMGSTGRRRQFAREMAD